MFRKMRETVSQRLQNILGYELLICKQRNPVEGSGMFMEQSHIVMGQLKPLENNKTVITK